MEKLLIISFDAVGDDEYTKLASRPAFARLLQRAHVTRGVSSVFITNTYPVHTSVATGVTPEKHGLINNTQAFPLRHDRWRYVESAIQSPTLWQAAHEAGLTVATVMWPVTGGAGSIRYNVPELLALPGQNQLLLSLRYGSKLLQMRLFLKYRHLLQGIRQPALDRFSTACMVDILRKHDPDLAMVHLTAYDSLCHQHGRGSAALEAAFDALDASLAALLAAAGDRSIILFSDHAQLPAENHILLNEILCDRGYLEKDNEGSYVENSGRGCFFECSGGSAFLHAGSLATEEIEALRQDISQTEGFRRFLQEKEMQTCGRKALAFGICAQPGYVYQSYEKPEKANHGFPLDYDDYKVFYLLARPEETPGESYGGSLLDIAPMAAEVLDLPPFYTQRP